MSEAANPCPQCSKPNPPFNRYCFACGTSLEIQCLQCSEKNPQTANFCGQCGGELVQHRGIKENGNSVPEANSTALSKQKDSVRTGSDDLLERILESKESFEGEIKTISVLFADLVNSTQLIQNLGAEAALACLQPAIDIMTSAVERNGGQVNRIQGDGIMALFGAPLACEDHAVRACLAALEMQNKISQLESNSFSLRVGMNSGEVIVRTIKNNLTLEYEADGPSVHLAARMEQKAQPGEIISTRATAEQVKGQIEVLALGPSAVEGWEEPVLLYKILSAVTLASRWEIRARKSLTPYTGREAELAVLSNAHALAADGQGQIVCIDGEAGMGKSRLVHEFLTGQIGKDWLVRVIASRVDRQSSPFWPIKTLAHEVVATGSENSTTEPEHNLKRYLKALPDSLASAGRSIAALTDHTDLVENWETLEPMERRQMLIDGFKSLVLHRASLQPLLLVFEDLHWIDSESAAALSALVTSLPGARILIVASYRPDFNDPWQQHSWQHQLRLNGLTKSNASKIATSLLGTDASLISLTQALIERSDGNPLFTEEIINGLIDSGQLKGSQGAYVLSSPTAQINIPDSVQAVLAARIDQLEPDTKRVLQCASILGRSFTHSLLAHVTELSTNDLTSHLARLVQAEFLFERESLPRLVYVFKHALTEHVAYNSLLKSVRTVLHAKALSAIKILYGDNQKHQLAAMAHHAFLGEQWEEAVTFLHKAGLDATAQSAYAGAREHLQNAMQALEHLPENKNKKTLALQIRLDIRPALGASGDYGIILQLLDEAEALARSTADTDNLSTVLADKIHVLYQRGNIEMAISTGQSAIATLTAADERIMAQINSNLAQAYFFRGDLARALASVEPFVDKLNTDWRHDRIGSTATSSVLWLSNRAGMLAECGRFPSAVSLAQQVLDIASETQRPFDMALAEGWYGFILSRQGKTSDAINHLRLAYSITTQHQLKFMQIWNGYWLGLALLNTTEIEEVIQLQTEALKSCQQLGLVSVGILARVALANALNLANQREKAFAEAQKSLNLIQKTNMNWAKPAALRCRAISTLHQKSDTQNDRPLSDLQEAIDICVQQGTYPELANCYQAQGEHYCSLGRVSEGENAMQKAAELRLEMSQI